MYLLRLFNYLTSERNTDFSVHHEKLNREFAWNVEQGRSSIALSKSTLDALQGKIQNRRVDFFGMQESSTGSACDTSGPKIKSATISRRQSRNRLEQHRRSRIDFRLPFPTTLSARATSGCVTMQEHSSRTSQANTGMFSDSTTWLARHAPPPASSSPHQQNPQHTNQTNPKRHQTRIMEALDSQFSIRHGFTRDKKEQTLIRWYCKKVNE
jgi:hypothetical protein